jgi:hypothetical protein
MDWMRQAVRRVTTKSPVLMVLQMETTGQPQSQPLLLLLLLLLLQNSRCVTGVVNTTGGPYVGACCTACMVRVLRRW